MSSDRTIVQLRTLRIMRSEIQPVHMPNDRQLPYKQHVYRKKNVTLKWTQNSPKLEMMILRKEHHFSHLF